MGCTFFTLTKSPQQNNNNTGKRTSFGIGRKTFNCRPITTINYYYYYKTLNPGFYQLSNLDLRKKQTKKPHHNTYLRRESEREKKHDMKKNPVVFFLFCPPFPPRPRYYIYLFSKYVREEKTLNDEKSEKKKLNISRPSSI